MTKKEVYTKLREDIQKNGDSEFKGLVLDEVRELIIDDLSKPKKKKDNE